MTSPALSGASQCASNVPGDSSFADCQIFCRAEAWKDHCKLCKCKACSFCSCSSDYEDDSDEQQCQSWCTADYYDDHCGRCKCKGCDFCKNGPPCTPISEDDLDYATCQPFCSADFASSHCPMCKCKGCDFCSAEALGVTEIATCTSGIKDDSNQEMCEAFCDPKDKDTHCGMCKCRACGFCECESEHADDSSQEECQRWCDGDALEQHCSWCACKGCKFCKLGGKECRSFYVIGDSDHEDCEDFCEESAADVHCGMCKCKRCGFCKALELDSKHAIKQKSTIGEAMAATSPLDAQSGPACFSGRGYDTLFETCEDFCEEAEHCQLCKCKACKLCSGSCDSGVAGDTTSAQCSAACEAAHATAVCSLCRCRGCPFCAADGTPKKGSDLEAGQCIPSSDKDIDHEECMGHCSITQKGKHCESCKCKACDFCEGFVPCESSIPHDTKWFDCDVSCKGKGSCEMCKCQSCALCQGVSQSSVSCDSGILDDLHHSTCLSGLCSPEHKLSHCQTCRCKDCKFCSDVDLIAKGPSESTTPCSSRIKGDIDHETCEGFCNPQEAADHCSMCKCKGCSFCGNVQLPCESEHISDFVTSSCAAAICNPDALPAYLLCSFCACSACGFCENVPPQHKVVASESGKACATGAELMTVSSHFDKGKGNWEYAALVRMGSWQAGAQVSLVFNVHGPQILLDGDSVERATLISSERKTFTFKLPQKHDAMRSFAFDFTVVSDGLDDSGAVSLQCSAMVAPPPRKPRPPPAPFPPFVRPPPPRPPGLIHAPDFCALGGRVKIISVWAGGSSFRFSVVMALWRPATLMTLDFGASARGATASHASNADIVQAPRAGALSFRLGSTPDEQHAFSVVGHGGSVHEKPVITCNVMGHGATAPPPPAQKAKMDPSCAPLGLMYEIADHWANGFKAVVAVRNWQPGALLSFAFPSPDTRLLDSWAAAPATLGDDSQASGSSFTLTLAEHSDPAIQGFGFTARSEGVPTISCELDKNTVGLLAVPLTLCGMRAEIKISLVDGEEGTEAAVAEVRVRIHQWEAGATVTITFPDRVTTRKISPTAAETSDAVGAVHTFSLGAHPDTLHGFSVTMAGAAASKPARLVCKPKEAKVTTTLDTSQIQVGSPEAPTGVQAVAASCKVLSLRWKPAVDNGFLVSGYTIYYKNKDTPESGWESLFVGVSSPPTASLEGLSGGTTYFIKVRARNARGDGKYSTRLTAETDAAGSPLQAPAKPEPLESRDCSSIIFALPALRPGCRGDSYLSLDGRVIGALAWERMVERTAEGTAEVSGLDPYATYEFRLTAHNKDGQSPPSEPSRALLTDAFWNELAPPTVTAASSASFALKWRGVAGPCRPALRWRISSSLAAFEAWRVADANASGSSYQAYPLRCPPPGCIFRVEPVAIRGWLQPALPSAPVPSLQLPSTPDGGLRVEVVLQDALLDRDLIELRDAAAADIANALRLPRSAIATVDVYGGGRYFVLDLARGRQAGSSSVTESRLLVQQLQLLVQELAGDARGGLRDGSVSAFIDPASGVRLVLLDGRLTPVFITGEARDSLRRLPRYYASSAFLLSGFNLGGAEGFTLSIALLAMGSAFLYGCIRHAYMVRSGAYLRNYGKVARDEVEHGDTNARAAAAAVLTPLGKAERSDGSDSDSDSDSADEAPPRRHRVMRTDLD